MNGSRATGGLTTTLAWASLALALLLLVLRRTGTRVLGVLALIGGVLALLSGITASFPAQDLTVQSAAVANGSSWRLVFAAAGLLTALGGVVALFAASRVPTGGESRYQRGSGRAATTDTGEVSERDPWKAMDAGEDPTADPR